MQWWLALVFGLLLMILGYTLIDQPISLYFSRAPESISHFADIFSWIIAPTTHLVAWPILFFYFYYLLRKKKATSLLLFIIAIPTSLLAVDIMKVIVGRARPEEWLNHGTYGFLWLGTSTQFLSFPSAHSATIGAIMGSLACFFPRKRLLLMALSILLAFCRVIALEHFFSDTLAGVLIAFLITQLIYWVMNKRRASTFS